MISYSKLLAAKKAETKEPVRRKLVRSYEPIWQELKRAGVCRISCEDSERQTIKKGVIEEKYYDIDFKLGGFTRLDIILVEGGMIFKLKDFRPLNLKSIL